MIIGISIADCSVEGCDRPSRSRGMCNMHYLRWHRRGGSGPAESLPEQIAERRGRGVLVESKVCSRCRERKPADLFHTKRHGSRDGLRPWCRSCSNEYARNYRTTNAQSLHGRHIKSRYGISSEEYEAILDAQGGVCAVCRQPNSQFDQRVGRERKLHVDHDHETGAVRGLLCSRCNNALGSAGDDPERLRALAVYLEVQR